MKFIPLLFITLASVEAQSVTENMLSQGLQAVTAGFAPVPAGDKAEILKITANTLNKHMAFRQDGTATAIYTGSGKRQVEWMKFVVRHIHAQPVNAADRLNGISKRYLVGFSCDAHRMWDSKKSTWGEWYPIGCVLFPAGISIEWKGDKWIPVETTMIKYFIPGPSASGPSPTAITPKPDSNSQGLPPGMMRVK